MKQQMNTIITNDVRRFTSKTGEQDSPLSLVTAGLSGDAFEDQMLFLASHGYRCIAHDRRGHGRSSQPEWQRGHLRR